MPSGVVRLQLANLQKEMPKGKELVSKLEKAMTGDALLRVDPCQKESVKK